MARNLLYPGRPNYKGPVQGVFGLLHHSLIAEWSHNVMERVEYVKREKPENEVEIRLWNMCYLSEERLPKEIGEAGKTWEEAGKNWKEARETYWTEALKTYNETWETREEAEKTHDEDMTTYKEAWSIYGEACNTYNKILKSSTPQILNLIKELVPDTTWNGEELIF